MFRFSFRLSRAVLGFLAVGIAMGISSFSIVRAEHAQPLNSVVYSCSNGTACVEGSSTGNKTWGVYGTATKTDGVHGVTSTTTGGSGVAGISRATSGKPAYGVYGSSLNGDGVYGTSSESSGVYGQSLYYNAAGVYGKNACCTSGSSGSGVYGETSNGEGVTGVATAKNGAGVVGLSTGSYGEGGLFSASGGGYALEADCTYTTNGCYPFLAQVNGSPGGYFQVDGTGDGVFSGSVTAYGGYYTVIPSRGGEHLGASIALTPEETMEDTGSGRLLTGEGAVHFDPAFASTINASRGYEVFLTPNGDTRGLYVSAKYEGGFIVRENEHGRSSVNFDYRVVAHPYGASDTRLPRLNIKLLSLPKLPQIGHPRP